MIYWVIFCVLDGIIDGFMFSKAKDYENKILNFDIHTFLGARRFAFIFGLTAVLGDTISLWAIFSMFLVQPFIHNGMYFETRKRMDGSYPFGFTTSKDEDDSSAKVDVDHFAVRLFLFLLGLAVFGFNNQLGDLSVEIYHSIIN